MSFRARRSSRVTSRINYSTFNSTGDRNELPIEEDHSPVRTIHHETPSLSTVKTQHPESPQTINQHSLSANTDTQSLNNTMASTPDKVASLIGATSQQLMSPNIEDQAILFIEEIDDLIEENPISEDAISETEATIAQLLELRGPLRSHHLYFRKNDPQHEMIVKIQATNDKIRKYLTEARLCNKKVKEDQTKLTQMAQTRKEESIKFTINDIKRSIIELVSYFKQDLDNMTDTELIQIKSEITAKTDTIHKIAKKYETILQTDYIKPELLSGVNIIGENYELMTQLRTTFSEKLESLLKTRDTYRQEQFATSNLNINLEKFSGYDSSVDFYTFKTNFNKLHQRQTPIDVLPDLLKNNFLKGPALTMVRSLTNIDDIWKQLQFAFGDVKLLLTKKLKHVITTEPLYKTKGAELAHTLSRLTTTLKEMVQLANEHKIEDHLYFSDGLHRIYNPLDEGRLTRWLRRSSEEDYSPKQSWHNFIKFLEQEQKLQQTKLTISQTIVDNPSKHNKPTDRSSRGSSHKGSKPSATGYHSSQSNTTPTCFICET